MTVPVVTRILLADDHAVVRRGLRALLDAEPDLRVVAEASDGIEARERGHGDGIDLAVLDVSMPGLTGLQVAAALARERPGLRILMLSMHDDEQYLFEALKAGASGYVLKSADNREFIEACRATMRGEPFLYPSAVTTLMRGYIERAAAGEEDAPRSPLTPREREVLKLIAEGHTGQEIAALLHISRKTADNHRASILEKLGLRHRVDLTRYAIRSGLVEP